MLTTWCCCWRGWRVGGAWALQDLQGRTGMELTNKEEVKEILRAAAAKAAAA